jgi:hypothetical protein
VAYVFGLEVVADFLVEVIAAEHLLDADDQVDCGSRVVDFEHRLARLRLDVVLR